MDAPVTHVLRAQRVARRFLAYHRRKRQETAVTSAAVSALHESSATLIQAVWRGKRARRWTVNARRAEVGRLQQEVLGLGCVILIQAAWRSACTRAALARAAAARELLRRKMIAAKVVQCAWRQAMARTALALRRIDQVAEVEDTVIEDRINLAAVYTNVAEDRLVSPAGWLLTLGEALHGPERLTALHMLIDVEQEMAPRPLRDRQLEAVRREKKLRARLPHGYRPPFNTEERVRRFKELRAKVRNKCAVRIQQWFRARLANNVTSCHTRRMKRLAFLNERAAFLQHWWRNLKYQHSLIVNLHKGPDDATHSPDKASGLPPHLTLDPKYAHAVSVKGEQAARRKFDAVRKIRDAERAVLREMQHIGLRRAWHSITTDRHKLPHGRDGRKATRRGQSLPRPPVPSTPAPTLSASAMRGLPDPYVFYQPEAREELGTAVQRGVFTPPYQVRQRPEGTPSAGRYTPDYRHRIRPRGRQWDSTTLAKDPAWLEGPKVPVGRVTDHHRGLDRPSTTLPPIPHGRYALPRPATTT